MVTAGKSTQIGLQNLAFASMIGFAYFLSACLSLHLSEGVGGMATIWPASGAFISALLLAKPGQTVPMVCAVAFASLAANTLFGASVPVSLGFTLANVFEGILISQVVVRISGAPRMLEDKYWVLTFFGATVVGSAASATIAAVLSGNLTLAFFGSWFLTVCLGTLIVTPLIVTIANGLPELAADFSMRRMWQLLLFAIGVATVSALALTHEEGRFLFFPVIGVVAATYLFGSRGAAITISVIAIVATVQTDLSGSTIRSLGLNREILFLQFYLLSLLCAAWPLSVLLAARKELLAQYTEANMYLKLAESTAHVGHWYIGSDKTSLIWSEEVFRIHGVKPTELKFDDTLDLTKPSSLMLYHPDDREMVRATLLEAMARHEGFTYKARIVRPDGSIRFVSSIGQPRYDATGAFEGLFGTIHDITEQIETMVALRIARAEALHEASASRRLAETDDLTGIANRRKILASLHAAASSARQHKEPLTIAIFDVDHFKAVNDRHGHQTGDEVLKRVATIASSQLRSTDSIGRLGGEEFLVILRGQAGSNSHETIERVRQRIASEIWAVSGLNTVTISAGIATLTDGGDIEDALRRADQALYRAKEAGRNALRSAA